jgi:hypothetical protein
MSTSALTRPVDLFHPLDLSDLLIEHDADVVTGAPIDLTDPLGLRDALAEATRSSGARGVVDLLAMVLTGRRVRSDSDIDAYLDRLKSACRQTRRHRELVPVLRRIVQLNPGRRHEVAAEIAVVHAHLREVATGVSVLEMAYRAQRRIGARRRSLEFCVLGEVAAIVLGRPDLAHEIAGLARVTANARTRAAQAGTGALAPALPVLDVPVLDVAVPDPTVPDLTMPDPSVAEVSVRRLRLVPAA